MIKLKKLYNKFKREGLTSEQEEIIQIEISLSEKTGSTHRVPGCEPSYPGIYSRSDMEFLQNMPVPEQNIMGLLKTLDELMEQDKCREKDGFPRRIRIGKLIMPSKDKKSKVVVVPSTTEPKFYHDDSITEDGEDETGGAGKGEEGDVIGEQQAQPEQGEGEGQGAGQGEGTDHDISSEAFDLGKVLSEKFDLPNLKNKGTKRSFSKYVYDLTDRNRGFGQVLDKKATLKKIVETNIQLGNIQQNKDFSPENLLISPKDHVYRILSKEKDFESQALVFFLRDYSGSMQGKPTEVITTQHLLIYSWLMYQYANNVVTRFIVHDTEAKEVPDFYTYYRSNVAGGTRVAPGFQLINKIVEQENLARDYNIYIFYGTDGDDWDSDGRELIEAIEKMLLYANRVGITVAKNSWSDDSESIVERNIIGSDLLTAKKELIRMDVLKADDASEDRIIESIRNLIG